MDDILSAALSESGLDEFFATQTSPVPGTSENYFDETSNCGRPSTSALTYDELSNDGSTNHFSSSSSYVNSANEPTSFIGVDETDGGCMMIPKKENVPQFIQSGPPTVQLIPRKRPPEVPKIEVKTEVKEEVKEKEMPKPLQVQVTRPSEQFENSCSPSPVTPRVIASQRSMTASPASTMSTNSGGTASAAQVDSTAAQNKLTQLGPVIKRTVQTKAGIQTQYLKPYWNEAGQKIYRVLNTIPASVNGRGGLPIRGTRTPQPATTRPNDRIVMVRQEGPNGQQVLVRKMIGTAANGGHVISSSPVYHDSHGNIVRRGGSVVTRAQPRGNVVIRNNQRGAFTTTGYRVANLVGRGTGGSTMTQHQPLSHPACRIGRAGSVASRVSAIGRGQGGIRYTTANRASVDRNGLHMSHSTPAFQYMDQDAVLSPRSMYPSSLTQKTASPGVVQARHMQSSIGNMQQRAILNRAATGNAMNRMVGGYDQADLARMTPQSRLMIASPSARTPGSGLSSPRTPQQNYIASPLSAAIPQTKSQKAKDEMKMAYQMGREEALQQRKNDMDDDEENLGYADIYSEYVPTKLRSGMAHPDSVVESASLSSVAPPDIKYQVSIPEILIDSGYISALQLEAVIYACQMHEKRMPSGERYGYLIGDGAGVGKGRTVASIIFENYIQGRKRAIWLSVSSDLKFDAERDLRDVGAPNISVHALNKLKYAKISGKENGSIKKGVIFATYTSLIGECRGAKSRKYRSRIKQLVQWFGTDYDGVIILDECHRAKNLVPSAGGKPTKTGRMVLEMQRMLPNARVVYASATGATEPRNMAYMTRLGLWGERQAFTEFTEFISAVERRGVGAMEIVAMDMKQRGLYLARQLSFRGVSFAVQEVQLTNDFIKMYDDSVKLWMEARRQFQAVLESMDEEERSTCKTVWGQFWACHQRFFKYLCIAAKVDTCVTLATDAVKAKKCVVVGLQSTGESATLETLEEMGGELNEFVSTAKAVLYGLIDKHFPSESSINRDIFKDFDRMCDSFDRPTKRRKANDTLSFLTDAGFGTWSGATVGMSGRVGQSKKDEDANSTTSESSSDEESDKEKEEEDEKGWDSEREEAEGARTLDDCDQDEWVKALLAEAESSSDSDEDENAEDDEESKQGPEEDDDDEKSGNEIEEEFNPFACDFTSDDPWANNQQIIDDKPVAKKGKKRKRVEDVETEEMKEKRKRREARQEKKIRRAARKAEREKKRRIEAMQSRGTASDFITSSRLCGNGDDDKSNINPIMIKTELLAAVERLAPALPANTLDQLIDGLGGPEYVAEMTGRRGHMITTETGEVQYQRRNAAAEVSLELVNMEEKEKFMKGEKLIAIISEAASSGISLQSDRRAINKRRRVHITLELPWSADKAIQQFGRTHRSNQVSGPEYVFLISELAGEKRFASVVAKRLESLGALTHGDRRATTENRDLSQYNMDNKYGRVALDLLLKTVIGQTSPPLIAPPSTYKAGDFFDDMRLYMEGVGLLAKNKNGQFTIEKDSATIPKFLNRILGLPVHAQNALFNYFSEIVTELIAQSKHDGTYDTGIMDLGTGDHQVRKLETRIFLGRVDNGSFRVEMHKIGVERGISWDEAMSLYKEHNTDEDGFYVCQPTANGSGRKVVTLVYGIKKVGVDNRDRLYAVTRPSTGRSPKFTTMADLSKRFSKTTAEEAKEIWNAQYDSAATMCQHNYIYGKCRTETSGTYCEVGRRTRTYFVLSGSVLSVWPIVEEVLASSDKKSSRMQVIRVRTEQDQKIVGLLVLPTHVRLLVQQLETHCGRSIVKTD